MQIICPTCLHAMSLKDARPGHYKPKCVKCGERFALTVHGEARPPKVAPLAEADLLDGGAAIAHSTAGQASTLAPGVATTAASPAKKALPAQPPLPARSDATTVPEARPSAAWKGAPSPPAGALAETIAQPASTSRSAAPAAKHADEKRGGPTHVRPG